jgi:protein-S-isoprenylcysteine O-methyltransferase Ste14
MTSIATAETRRKAHWSWVLGRPWIDRTIAIIASVPFVWLAHYRYQHLRLGLPLVSSVTVSLVLIVTMLLRRPPKRVTLNPAYWLLAFLATYWPLLILGELQQGRPVVPSTISDTIAICALAVTLWARFSLGRNIGFVPAQRDIVTGGAYRYMRHPIYTGVFLGSFALALRAYTPRNVAVLGLGALWFVIKSFVEENFLRADPQYAAYLNAVRARWIPYVV